MKMLLPKPYCNNKVMYMEGFFPSSHWINTTHSQKPLLMYNKRLAFDTSDGIKKWYD